MNPRDYLKVKKIFQSAAELSPTKRCDFLDQKCGDDIDLRLEVDRLLDARVSEFLEDPLMAQITEDIVEEEASSKPTRILPDNEIRDRFGHYRIISEIAKGGMGVVYLAKDTSLDRKVALKVLPSELTNNRDRLTRFEQEARAASALNHPNILTIYEFGQNDNGTHFIASEYVEGKTLSEFCGGDKVILPKKLDITIQLASALAASHEAGIIHRDIKPDNIIVRPDGYIKVLDFGLAKLTEDYKTTESDSEGSTRIMVETRSKMVMGTVPYMSPEQARGRNTDERTDIWSLGVVLYEMLTGNRPFKEESDTDTIISIIQKEALPITVYEKGLPSELEWVVSRTLSKNINDRYQTMKELHVDLSKIKKHVELGDELGPTLTLKIDDNGKKIESPTTIQKVIPPSSQIAETTAGAPAKTGSLTMARRYSIFQAGGFLLITGIFALSLWWFFINDSATIDSSPRISFKSVEITSWSSGPAELSTSASISPDGEMIAFGAVKSGTPGIWVIQPTSGNPIPVTKDKFYNRFPIWSPSGKELAYYSKRGNEFGIWRIAFTGGQSTLIGTVKYAESRPRYWSKSGKIYYQNAVNLFLINEKTGENKQITDLPPQKGAARIIRLSPDEKMIAFVNKDGPDWKILSGSVDGTDSRVLVSSKDKISDLVWHPNEKKILYSQLRDKVYQIFEFALTGGRPVQISNSDFDSHVQDIAADGERILLTSAREIADIWRVDTDKQKETIVVAGKEAELWADLSRDGKEIAYQSIKDLNRSNNLYTGSIWKKDVQETDGRAILLTEDGFLPRWSPDGNQLAFLRHRDEKFELWTIRASGGEPRRIAYDGIQGFRYSMTPYNRVVTKHLSWAPTNDAIAYPATKNSLSNLWLSYTDEEKNEQITGNENKNLRLTSPIWASDGKSIGYSSVARRQGNGGKPTYHIWIKEIGRSNEQKLFEAKNSLRLLGFNKSEDKLIFAQWSVSTGFTHTPSEVDLYEVGIRDADISKINTLKNANFYNIHLSPDRKSIAFSGRSGELEQIWITPLYGGGSRRLIESNDPRKFFSSLTWSPDGKSIFFGKQSRFSMLSMLSKPMKKGE